MGPGRARARGRAGHRLRTRRPAGPVCPAGSDRRAVAEAPSFDETDWPQLLALYDRLLTLWPSPVVALNRLVPLSMVDGPQVALAQISSLERDGRLSGYQYLHAVKADLLQRLGRSDEAAGAYDKALALCANAAERAFLTEQIAGLRASTQDPSQNST